MMDSRPKRCPFQEVVTWWILGQIYAHFKRLRRGGFCTKTMPITRGDKVDSGPKRYPFQEVVT
jgi:hypothetical protein